MVTLVVIPLVNKWNQSTPGGQNPQTKDPTHRIMTCLSKYRKYRECYENLQSIEEDLITPIYDEIESVTSDHFRFLSSPNVDILTLDSDSDWRI